MWDWVTYDPQRPAGRVTFVMGGLVVPMLLGFVFGYLGWLFYGRALVLLLALLMAARRLKDMGETRLWLIVCFVPLLGLLVPLWLAFAAPAKPEESGETPESMDVLAGEGLPDTLAEVE